MGLLSFWWPFSSFHLGLALGFFLAFDFLLGSFPFTYAPACCFLRLLSVPSVCPTLAPILALARVSHYFSVFPSWCLGRISVPLRRGPPSGPSLFCRGFRTFFPMVHFLSTSLSVFSSASFVSVPLSVALSLILGFSQLLLFPLFFLGFSSHHVAVHLSAFKLIIYVFYLLLGRNSPLRSSASVLHRLLGRCAWRRHLSPLVRCVLGIPSLARSHIGCAMSLW